MCIKLFRYKCIYIKLCSPCMLWKKKKDNTLIFEPTLITRGEYNVHLFKIS